MLLTILLFYISLIPGEEDFSFACSLALFISSSSVICLFISFAISLLGLSFFSSLCILGLHPFLFYIYHKIFSFKMLNFFAALPPFPSINRMHFD